MDGVPLPQSKVAIVNDTLFRTQGIPVLFEKFTMYKDNRTEVDGVEEHYRSAVKRFAEHISGFDTSKPL